MTKRYTIPELAQMRESEDHVEFKKGEGGNVSYNGNGKTSPTRGDVAYWVMWLHSVTKVAVA